MCNAVVDPLPYIAACQYDTCKSSDPLTAACPSFESYARECARYQVCLTWRSPEMCPIECPSGMEHQQCGSGCQSVCGQSKDLMACPMSVNDGCYCPAGRAFNQALGRCVALDHCEPCDSEGHYRGSPIFSNDVFFCFSNLFKILPFLGDHWKPDACTSCTCNDEGHVACAMKSCALEECPPKHKRTIIQPASGVCCPSIKCELEEESLIKQPCPELPVPICRDHQMLIYQEVNGCLHQLCDCVPSDQCPKIEPISANPLVGVTYIVNSTGCCPRLERICNQDECPPKPECPPFYEIEVKNSWEELCCPEFQCVPPKDVCIYEHTHGQGQDLHKGSNSKGHTKKTGVKSIGKRNVQFRPDSLVHLYAINATWKDGPCLECKLNIYDKVFYFRILFLILSLFRHLCARAQQSYSAH